MNEYDCLLAFLHAGQTVAALSIGGSHVRHSANGTANGAAAKKQSSEMPAVVRSISFTQVTGTELHMVARVAVTVVVGSPPNIGHAQWCSPPPQLRAVDARSAVEDAKRCQLDLLWSHHTHASTILDLYTRVVSIAASTPTDPSCNACRHSSSAHRIPPVGFRSRSRRAQERSGVVLARPP